MTPRAADVQAPRATCLTRRIIPFPSPESETGRVFPERSELRRPKRMRYPGGSATSLAYSSCWNFRPVRPADLGLPNEGLTTLRCPKWESPRPAAIRTDTISGNCCGSRKMNPATVGPLKRRSRDLLVWDDNRVGNDPTYLEKICQQHLCETQPEFCEKGQWPLVSRPSHRLDNRSDRRDAGPSTGKMPVRLRA